MATKTRQIDKSSRHKSGWLSHLKIRTRHGYELLYHGAFNLGGRPSEVAAELVKIAKSHFNINVTATTRRPDFIIRDLIAAFPKALKRSEFDFLASGPDTWGICEHQGRVALIRYDGRGLANTISIPLDLYFILYYEDVELAELYLQVLRYLYGTYGLSYKPESFIQLLDEHCLKMELDSHHIDINDKHEVAHAEEWNRISMNIQVESMVWKNVRDFIFGKRSPLLKDILIPDKMDFMAIVHESVRLNKKNPKLCQWIRDLMLITGDSNIEDKPLLHPRPEKMILSQADQIQMMPLHEYACISNTWAHNFTTDAVIDQYVDNCYEQGQLFGYVEMEFFFADGTSTKQGHPQLAMLADHQCKLIDIYTPKLKKYSPLCSILKQKNSDPAFLLSSTAKAMWKRHHSLEKVRPSSRARSRR